MQLHKMEDLRIEQKAAETILQRGVKVKARAPLLLRMIGIKRITMTLRNPSAGTLMRVASYYLNTGITAEELSDISGEHAVSLIAKHGRSLRMAVAAAILNGWISGWLFVRPVAWYLSWSLSERAICALMDALIDHGGVADFITTTRYIRGMKITSPNLGQTKKKGS